WHWDHLQIIAFLSAQWFERPLEAIVTARGRHLEIKIIACRRPADKLGFGGWSFQWTKFDLLLIEHHRWNHSSQRSEHDGLHRASLRGPHPQSDIQEQPLAFVPADVVPVDANQSLGVGRHGYSHLVFFVSLQRLP